ncbi:MAG: GNAT family N-acetyltransferase [Actinomycetota bacterium]|jgi:ribosomal protein S18 acetylase RimI-like enzyme
MALLVVLDGSGVPMAEHYRQWRDELAELGFLRVRTGALSARQAAQADVSGMRCVQELELLQLDAPLPRFARRGSGASLRPMLSRDLATVEAIDRAAFGEYWWLDAGMLADVCGATPRHRARVVEVDRRVTGSLISGRSGSIGYIQRLSVHPDAHRRGLATALLGDALTWMRRAGVTRVFVNTHADNDAALALYRRIGFRSLPERLRVYEGPTGR